MKTILTPLILTCLIILCSCAHMDECQVDEQNSESCIINSSNYKNYNIYSNIDDEWFSRDLLESYIEQRANDQIYAHFEKFSVCEGVPQQKITDPAGNCKSWINDTNIKPDGYRLRTSGRAMQICIQHLEKIVFREQQNVSQRNKVMCEAEARSKPPSASELRKLELEKLKKQKEDDDKKKILVARREALLIYQQQMQYASKNRSLKTSDYYIGLICSYPVNGGMAAQLVSTWLPLIANPNAMQNMMTTDSGKFCKLTYARPSLEFIKNADLVNLDEQHSYFVLDRDPVAVGIVGTRSFKK